MPYENFEIASNNDRIVDLRSDTISKPTTEMRNAMRDADVGDDVFQEDPTVKKLENRSAELLGKECALFVPSGTMANLIAIMVHCSQRGCEIIAGDLSHTFLYEQAGAAQIAGVQLATIQNEPDGTFSLNELKKKIRVTRDVHLPITSLILVENTHNMCGGKVLPLPWLDKLSIIAKQHSIPLHMDGARLFNASVQSKTAPKRIVQHFDSVCFCLSKNLGVPLGSILLGTKQFIEQARRMRKVLGGGMRQVGIIAAAGLVALDQMVDRLVEDHRRTFQIGKAIADMNGKYFKVDLDSLQTNILMVELETEQFTSKEVIERLATIKENDQYKISVRTISRNPKSVRITLYHNITDEDVHFAIEKIKIVINEFEKNY